MSVVTLVSIDDFVARLRKFPATSFDGTDHILRFMEENPVDPAGLERYLFWDAQHYTRNLIDKTELYELIAICWDSGHVSSVHNHREQNCWMAVPVGRLMVQNYRVLEQDLKAGILAPSTRWRRAQGVQPARIPRARGQLARLFAPL